MNSNYNFFLILFLNLSWCSALKSQKNVQTGERPKWADQIDFELKVETEESPFVYLLVDMQENAISNENYYHYAIKLNNTDGIQEMSTISIDYDPSFERIEFHGILIHRENEILERPIQGFQFLQRETDLNRAIYNGEISVVKELEDIRKGDILEYSYTVHGYNPIYGTHRFSTFYQDYGVYINKLYQTYHIDKSVNIKYSLGAAKAKIIENDGISKYTWSLKNLNPEYEDYTVPSWINQLKTVSISSMTEWKEVVTWGEELYKMTGVEKTNFRYQIEKLFNLTGTEEDIMHAIRFVQDEIRYLGFEDGIKAFKPNQPLKVLNRRFGDCKDKSFLLSSILTEMGIESAPFYVHSNKGKSLDKKLPSPNEFNHCIVSFKMNNNQFFIDPTITNQGGNLENLNNPNYGFGLPIRANSKGLMKIENENTPLIITDEVLQLDSIGGGAIYTISTKYTGVQSDGIRSYFSSNSRSEIKDEYEDYYRSVYPNIKISLLDIIDTTRETKNEIIVNESYEIKKIWEVADEHLMLKVYSLVLEDYLYLNPHEKIILPLYLGELKEYVQTIKVVLPEPWQIENEVVTKSNANFDFRSSIEYDKNEIQIKYRYFLKNNVVEVDQIENVTTDINEILNDITYMLSYNKNLLQNNENIFAWPNLMIWLLGGFLGFVLIYLVEQKFNPSPVLPNESLSIGGWLILPAIGLVFSPFMLMKDIILLGEEGLYSLSTWKILWSEGHYDLMGVVIGTGLINIFSVVASIYLIFIFFKRRSSTPTLIICFYMFTFIAILFDSYLAYIYDPQEEVWNIDVIKTLISCLIWVPYFLISKRVKNTFVIQKSKTIIMGEDDNV